VREADNVGSGLPAEAGQLDELRARIAAQFEAGVALDLRGLAVDGTDLMNELGLEPGPTLGRLLDLLLEKVVADPALNTRVVLLELAARTLTGMRARPRGSAT